ncbi:MAG: ribosome-binding factor A [Candidatus Portnoybacteria bacterium]|nr:ribosome-binding factor A [Candidatus Portnoybacteria bacterium]
MSHRIARVNEVIKEEVGRIILEQEDFGSEVFLTILSVDSSPDLTHSNIMVSVFPSKKSQSVLKILNHDIFDIQQELNKKLNMRPVPKIRFVLTETEEEAEKIEKILEEDDTKN